MRHIFADVTALAFITGLRNFKTTIESLQFSTCIQYNHVPYGIEKAVFSSSYAKNNVVAHGAILADLQFSS